MSAPKRLFKYFTDAQLQTILASLVARATSGEFTSLSGAAKSSSKAWMDLQQELFEINYEFDFRNGIQRPAVVVQDLTGIYNNQDGEGMI